MYESEVTYATLPFVLLVQLALLPLLVDERRNEAVARQTKMNAAALEKRC